MVRRREGLTLPVLSSTPTLPDPRPDVRTTAQLALEKPKQRLSKQLSMCEAPRDAAWEKRRRHMLKIQAKKNKGGAYDNDCDPTDLTDEDLRELKGSIELGFGFKEEAGQKLCNTLPALDLYFAVNRQLSPLPSPSSSNIGGDGSLSSTYASSSSIPCSPKTDSDSLKILCPGDNPQQVKQRLKHWAQAVACSVMQSHYECM